MLDSKIEKEANIFATDLLIPDIVIMDNKELTTQQLSRLLGYQEQIIQLKLAEFKDENKCNGDIFRL